MQSLDDLRTFASWVHQAGWAPKGYTTAASIAIGIQMGAELGLDPMQSLQSIAVINGVGRLWGDAPLAICKSCGVFVEEDFEEHVVSEGKDRVAFCTVRRIGGKPVTRRFSVQDATVAKLWGKPGPWTEYPERMLQLRARGFALRDVFPDALKGFPIAEVAADILENSPPAPDTFDANPRANSRVELAKQRLGQIREMVGSKEPPEAPPEEAPAAPAAVSESAPPPPAPEPKAPPKKASAPERKAPPRTQKKLGRSPREDGLAVPDHMMEYAFELASADTINQIEVIWHSMCDAPHSTNKISRDDWVTGTKLRDWHRQKLKENMATSTTPLFGE